MFKSSRNNGASQGNGHGPADTSLIARGTIIRGDVHFAGTLHLDGQIEGSVQAEVGSESTFTLSELGRVTGEIRVPHALINGTVVGNIDVSERLELAAQARVEGDIRYKVLEMVAGSQVNGKFAHQPGSETPRQLSAPGETEPAVGVLAEA
jgi:cytoskeletal protein CcmA (bactofilin family)